MKKMLFALIAVVMAIAMIGSAFAYFTDVAPSTNNQMTAGTLNLKVSVDGGATYHDSVGAVITSPSNWAPGASFTSQITYLKNAGTIDAHYVFGRACSLNESVAGFSKYIAVTAMSDDPGSGEGWETTTFDPATTEGKTNIGVWLNYWDPTDYPSQTYVPGSYISLYDLVYLANPAGGDPDTGFYFYDEWTNDATPWLPAGSIGRVSFSFELMDNITNTYQGASLSFELDFIASQGIDNLATYITQPLGTPPPQY